MKAELIFKENRSHSVVKQTKLRKGKQKRGENNRNRRKKEVIYYNRNNIVSNNIFQHMKQSHYHSWSEESKLIEIHVT